jgi:cell division inhibitor SepF
MANPISSMKDFFGWNGNNGGQSQPAVDRSQQSSGSSIGSILTGGQGRRSNGYAQQGTIVTFDVTSYADAKQIAETYRNGASVIVNMADMSELDQRRMVDFMGGLKEGLEGGLSRVATKVFLLVPATVQTNATEGDDDEFGPADGLVINPMR